MQEQRENTRKVREGVVVSNKMQKTVTVQVERLIAHPRFVKRVKRVKKYYAHCGDLEIENGQRVLICETRPLSKTKKWRVIELIKEERKK